jgi:5-methylcytosine-specific restriction enzyme subunit McrC
METDISLRNEERTIIVDTKFYAKTLGGQFEPQRLHAHNLYQLFAYIKNVEQRGGPDRLAEGILLYPTVSTEINHSTVIQGHRMSARTIDLTMPWDRIRVRPNSLLM